MSRLAILDIVPTKTIYETIDKHRASTVWRYFFVIQPYDLPERLIGSAPGVAQSSPSAMSLIVTSLVDEKYWPR